MSQGAISPAMVRDTEHHDIDQRHGLEWVDETFDFKPQWTEEPSIASIEVLSRHHLHVLQDQKCTISFFKQGAFNKLYKIDTDSCTQLMRVVLPVDPHLKTASEVATMAFVSDRTSISLPSITSYDSNNQNPLGFEYIIMTMGPSQTLSSVWRSLAIAQKEALVDRLAEFQAQLFDHAMQRIGNLYHRSSELTPGMSELFELGPMVAMTFFWGDRHQYNPRRGPFRNSFEWLDARLHLMRLEKARILETADDESDLEDAARSMLLAEQLHKLLPSLFDADAEDEKSIIFHDDMSMHNILVDEHRQPYIIDWECVSALPLWKACQYPAILVGRTRTEEPKKADYGTEELYWEDQMDYERQHLRASFWAKMERLRPQWIEEHERGVWKRDFEQAVHNCDNELVYRLVKRWIEAFEKSEPISLEGLFFQ